MNAPAFTRSDKAYNDGTMAPGKTCPKCSGIMEEGFLPEHGRSFVIASTWHEGEPEPSFWRGTKIDPMKEKKIRSFRCVKCGFIELYAN